MLIDEMLDIDINKELPEDRLILCKLNEEPIQELHLIDNLVTKKYHASIDEITFNVYLNRSDKHGNVVRNEIYDMIDGDMLILLNDMQYFYIDKPVIHSNEESGEMYKSIHCFSREFELGQKKVIGYNGISRLVYSPLNEKDENGLEIGYLNYLERVTSWKVGYVSGEMLLRYRELSFPNSNLLQANKVAQESFGCLFKYNTVDKVIDVYEATQLGTNQGLYISDENFIQSLEKTIDHNEIKTRIYVYGKDNLSIQDLNISGQPHLENFDFYKSTKYMSQGLIDALDGYQAHIENYKDVFSGHLGNLETLHSELVDRTRELESLNVEMKVIQNEIDVAISTSSPLGALKTRELAKHNDINIKESEIVTLRNSIGDINQLIGNMNVESKLSNFLDETQLKELDPFIKEDIFTDSNYTDDNIQELYDKGVEVLGRISYPSVQFSLDIEDLLSMVECQHVWSKLSRGDIVTIEHTKMGFQYQVRLIAIEYDRDNNKLTLKFSNQGSLDDASIYLSELIESMNVTSSTVDFSKYKWNKGDIAESMITKYVNSNFDLAKQSLDRAEGQVIVDDRGYWGYKINPDGTRDPKQLRMTNDVIAMTQDSWNTVDVAISPTLGINATMLNGKVGNLATVNADQINIGDFGETLSDDIIGGNITRLDKDYLNGIRIDSTDGIVATRNDQKVKTYLNATSGIKIETKLSSDWESVFSVDLDGNLKIKGNITLTGGHIDWDSVNKFEVPIGYTDEDTINAIKSTYIDASGVWTPQVYATNISALKGKIQTAQIEDLIVGGNVTMGSLATIKWTNVDDKPTDLVTDGKLTTELGKDYIITGKIKANQLMIGGLNGTISFDDLDNRPNTTKIDANGVYTGTLTAGQINAISGITLGANATINWGVVNTPSASQVGALPSDTHIPSDAYITNITKNTITTDYLKANFTETNISQVNKTLTLGSGGELGSIMFGNGCTIKATRNSPSNGYAVEHFAEAVRFTGTYTMFDSGYTYFFNTVDFNSATVRGLTLRFE